MTQWRQPETAQYTGFIIFPKSQCSTDFMKALGDGRIKFDLLDVKSQYTPQFTYYRDDGSRSSLTIQYRSVNQSGDSLLMTRGDSMILVKNFSTWIFLKSVPTCPRGWTVYRKNKNKLVEYFKMGGNRQKCRKFSLLNRFYKS